MMVVASCRALVRKLLRSAYSHHLLAYVGLLLVSSASIYLAALVNLVSLYLAVRLCTLVNYPWSQAPDNGVSGGGGLLASPSLQSLSAYKRLNFHLACVGLGNYLTLKIMTDAYAEILPWENILAVLFYAVAFYFYWRLTFKIGSSYTEIGPEETRWLSLDYKLARQDGNDKQTVLPLEVQEKLNWLKFMLFLSVASVYTAQLTFTTVCTPIMLLDWFLVPRNCGLFFSNFYISICTSSGFLTLSTTLVTLVSLVAGLSGRKRSTM